MNFKDLLHKISLKGEKHFEKLKTSFKERMGFADPVMILPYRSFGNTKQVFVWGRVLENEGIDVKEDDHIWDNILNTYRRFESDEIPNTRIEATYQGISKQSTTDEEGYYFIEFSLDDTITPHESMWEKVELRLLDITNPDTGEITAIGEVQVHDETKEYGIISDIDDTVLQTHATNMLTSAQLTFLGNAYLRKPFWGVGELYKALQNGSDGNQQNPVHYVSSSMWNLYDLLTDFFEIQNLPKAPIQLRDIGIDKNKFVSGDHFHKEKKIERIFSYYPNISFVLIGDSGQDDAFIYAKIAKNYPHQVKAIYIRDVNREAQRAEIEATAKQVREETGIPFLLAADSEEVAQHAADIGLLPKDAVLKVAEAKKEDLTAPTNVADAIVKDTKEI